MNVAVDLLLVFTGMCLGAIVVVALCAMSVSGECSREEERRAACDRKRVAAAPRGW